MVENKNEIKEPLSLMDAIYARHSVRQYTEEGIDSDSREELEAAVATCNTGGNLMMQVVYEEPKMFSCNSAKIVKFKNAVNYIMLMGEPAADLEERCGYYGELIVLKLQQMGLNSCWVGGTYNQAVAKAATPAECKFVALIAFGHGANEGQPHGGKFLDEICQMEDSGRIPAWFKLGAEAVLLAPTAKGKQNYKLILRNEEPMIRMTRLSSYVKVDLGILKCHFEMVSGHKITDARRGD